MIFDKEKISFDILDVLEIEQKDIRIFNSNRNFDALSFRFIGNTVLKTKDGDFSLNNNSINFVPSRIDYTRISKHDKLIVIHFHSLNYFSKSIETFLPPNPEKLGELFKEILKCWQEKPLGYKHTAAALLNNIFAELYRQAFKETKLNPKMRSAVEYLKENYKNPELTIKQAAQKSFISEVYFRRLFKEEFGISPQKYIINARIKYAVGLIECGYYTLGEVAEMSGFTDYKYFSSVFHKALGVPPSKYIYTKPLD